MKKNKKKNRNRTPNLRILTCDQTPMTSHHFSSMTIFLIYLKSREMDTFMKWLLYCVILPSYLFKIDDLSEVLNLKIRA